MISLFLALLGAPGAPCHTLEEDVFVELLAGNDTYFEHESIQLRLRIGFEREFLETRVVQPFRRPLDLPARLEAPWLDGLACALVLPTEPGDGPTLAVGDEMVAATRATSTLRGGREFAVVELERTLLPTCTGALTLPGSTLRYAFATSFSGDVFDGRVPDDPRDATVHGAGLTLTIRPLPREGRPLDFTGAVGNFTLRAEAERTRLAVGESFTLELIIEGQGDLTHFDPPRFAELTGFHERGRIDNQAPSARVLILDLTATDATVTEVPALSFAFFDPGLPGYRTVHSEPIALELELRAPATRHLRSREASESSGGPERPKSGRGRSMLRLLLAVLVIVSVVRILTRRRRASGTPSK